MAKDCFSFKQFSVHQDRCAMKVGTDGTLLGAWAIAPEGKCRILDIGTGTGLIALMMAQRYPQAEIVGIDIDSSACSQARENVNNSPFKQRISIVNIDINDYIPPKKIDKIRRKNFLENEKKKEEWRKSRPPYPEYKNNAIEAAEEKKKEHEKEMEKDPIKKIKARYKNIE